jgi:hypothetical protein
MANNHKKMTDWRKPFVKPEISKGDTTISRIKKLKEVKKSKESFVSEQKKNLKENVRKKF